MRRTFHHQLAEAEERCVAMAGLVVSQLGRTLEALRRRDLALAEAVIAGDDQIDEAYIDLERRILTLLATQAPVASDLRLVSALLHIDIHLERMGDLCTNVAKLVRLIGDLPVPAHMVDELVEMGSRAGQMLEVAMRAFTARDVDLASSLPGMDEAVDRLNRGMIRAVAEAAGDEGALEAVARLVVAARQLERIGDHAVDIGEQVAFLVTGQLRGFTDASRKEG